MKVKTVPPLVSVVMAVYNGQSYLREAVESILKQTLCDFEFIIVNDGSTDSSSTILRDLSTKDARIRVLEKPNEGIPKALNFALRECRGEFVARFDADDVSLPDRFEKQVDALEADEALVLLGSEVELITKDGLRLGQRGHPRNHPEIRKRLLLGYAGTLTQPAVMIRRSALESIGGYDEEFATCEDLDIFLRLSEVGKAENLTETLLQWRRHESSANQTTNHLWMSMRRRAIEKTIRRVGPVDFAEQLFYESHKPPEIKNPLNLGRIAERKGRFGTAAHLYFRGLRTPGLKAKAVTRFASLALRASAQFVPRSWK